VFNGHRFKPHGIIVVFPIDLGEKIISTEVELVDALLEYNILLGNSWFYMMMVVVSLVFRVLHFPHEGKNVTIYHLSYCTLNSRNNISSNIPFVGDSKGAYDSISVGMFKDSFFMGTFTLPLPISSSNSTPICMISLGTIESQCFSSASSSIMNHALQH
jgi:hypothetical protein